MTSSPSAVETLAACPFCGDRPKVTKHFKHDLYGLVHRCKILPAIIMDFAEAGYNETKWNTRTPVAADKPSAVTLTEGEVEALEHAAQRYDLSAVILLEPTPDPMTEADGRGYQRRAATLRSLSTRLRKAGG